jgi:hypothetical protein
MLNFVHQCLSSESVQVFSIVKHAILYDQADSIVGCNVLQRCSRYLVNIEDVLQSSFRHNNIGQRVAFPYIQTAIANCLIKLLACGNGALQLSHSDVITLIDWICTC